MAWKEFDIAHDNGGGGAERKILENPLWVPKRATLTAGGDATVLSGYIRMQNRFGQPLEDIWQSRVGNIASLGGQSSQYSALVNPDTLTTANELHHDRLGWDLKGRLTTVRDDVLRDPAGLSTSPWANDIATLYDCRDRIIYTGHGNRPDGGGEVTSGPGGGDGLGGAGQGTPEPRPARRAQSWDYDSPGNIKGFRDNLSDSEPAGDNTRWDTAHDGGDKATQRLRTVNGVPDAAAVVLLSDELGNLSYDGRWHFEYDVLGRMIGAYRPSAADPQVRGTLFARVLMRPPAKNCLWAGAGGCDGGLWVRKGRHGDRATRWHGRGVDW